MWGWRVVCLCRSLVKERQTDQSNPGSCDSWDEVLWTVSLEKVDKIVLCFVFLFFVFFHGATVLDAVLEKQKNKKNTQICQECN